jgi:hypothetical protein
VTAAFFAHMYNALLSEFRARHGVSQPRPSDMIPTISDVPLNHHALSNYIVMPSHFFSWVRHNHCTPYLDQLPPHT